MKNTQQPEIEIIYKNDPEAKNKLASFLINLILEQNNLFGEMNVPNLPGSEGARD